MSGAGDFDHRVTVFKPAGASDGDMGAMAAGASRWASVRAVRGRDDDADGAQAAVELTDIAVRVCPETRGWASGMMLREDFGPAGLSRVFAIDAAGVPDASGAVLVFRCEAGRAGDLPDEN